jgi:tetratricopeptide (TPR) repeat protein
MSTFVPIRPALCVAVAAVALSVAVPAFAQPIQGLPQASPQARVEQTIGITEVALDYHRPAVNTRKIWGGLVPYGEVWRAGANENTTISFSDPVKVEGQPLAAGTYGLHMIPTESTWTIIFSHAADSWGSFTYDEKEDALRVTVKPEKAPFAERLSYRFEDVTVDTAIALLHWEELAVPFEITTDTKANTLVYLRRQLRGLPRFSWQGWASAATYCLQNNFDQEEGLDWIEHSLGLSREPQNLMIKAGLLQQLGRTEESNALLGEALSNANEVQTNAIGYQFMQRNEFDRAIEIFVKNTKDHPDSWNVWDSLGEAYAAKGDAKAAIASYTKALNMTEDEAQKTRIRGVLQGLGKS